jgi:orotidine-5'-phosphate decarboxylase
MTAQEKLTKKNNEQKLICVGLDSDINRIPPVLRSEPKPVLSFNKAIIESTSKYAAAYKLNFAFYEKAGTKGFELIEETIKLIPDEVLIIADAKRGDIGNTSQMYASAVYEYFKCDAVTINPYMGYDSVAPFLEYKDKLNFILALTSNKGADDFEKLKLSDGTFVYQIVINKVSKWNIAENCGIVFGATQIEELSRNIKLFNTLPVLLPGVGAQGGNIEEVIKLFKANKRLNLLINSSRGIIYKDNSSKFAEAAENEIIKLNETVKNILGY